MQNHFKTEYETDKIALSCLIWWLYCLISNQLITKCQVKSASDFVLYRGFSHLLFYDWWGRIIDYTERNNKFQDVYTESKDSRTEYKNRIFFGRKMFLTHLHECDYKIGHRYKSK